MPFFTRRTKTRTPLGEKPSSDENYHKEWLESRDVETYDHVQSKRRSRSLPHMGNTKRQSRRRLLPKKLFRRRSPLKDSTGGSGVGSVTAALGLTSSGPLSTAPTVASAISHETIHQEEDKGPKHSKGRVRTLSNQNRIMDSVEPKTTCREVKVLVEGNGNNALQQPKDLQQDALQEEDLEYHELECALLNWLCPTRVDSVHEKPKLQLSYRDLMKEVEEQEEERRIANSSPNSNSTEHARESPKNLQNELDSVATDTEHARETLKELQNELEHVTKSWKQALADVERLTSEKSTWETEQRRTRQSAEIDFKPHSLTIDDLGMEWRNLLRKPTTESVADESIEIEFFDQNQNSLLDKAVENELELDLSASPEEESAERIESVHELKKKLDMYSGLISSLRAEVSRNYDELMTTSTRLEELQRGSNMMDSVPEDIEALLAQKDELRDIIHAKDTEIAELSAEILKMQMEKEFDQHGSSGVNSLRRQMADLEKDRDSLRTSCGQELGDAKATIQRLERALHEATQEAEAAAIKQLEHDEIVSSLQSKIEALVKTGEDQKLLYESTISTTSSMIGSLQSKLDELRAKVQAQDLDPATPSSVNALGRSSMSRVQIPSMIEEKRRLSSLPVMKKNGVLLQLPSAEADVVVPQMIEQERLHGDDTTNGKKTPPNEPPTAQQKAMDTMQKELDSVATELQEHKHYQGMSDMISNLRDQQSSLELKIERIGFEAEDSNRRYVRALARKEGIIVSLRRDYAVLKEKHDKQAEEHKRVLSTYPSQTDGLKDMEQLHLRIQIQEQNETSRAIEHPDHIVSKQVFTAEERSKMQAEIDSLSLMCSKLEEDLKNQLTERNVEVTRLNLAISDLERIVKFSELSLMDYERKVNENTSERTKLLTKIEALEQSANKLHADCCRLQQEKEDMKQEIDSLAYLANLQSGVRDQEREEQLKEELSEAEARLVQQDDQLAEMEEVLQERTRVLEKVVNKNKETEAALSEKELQLNAVEKRIESLQQQIADKEQELEGVRDEWKRTENKYRNDVLELRKDQKTAEVELSKAKDRIQSMQRGIIHKSDVERENRELKDKIRRQEAFLMKKLEKEKALRQNRTTPQQRVILGSNTTSCSSSSIQHDETTTVSSRTKTW